MNLKQVIANKRKADHRGYQGIILEGNLTWTRYLFPLNLSKPGLQWQAIIAPFTFQGYPCFWFDPHFGSQFHFRRPVFRGRFSVDLHVKADVTACGVGLMYFHGNHILPFNKQIRICRRFKKSIFIITTYYSQGKCLMRHITCRQIMAEDFLPIQINDRAIIANQAKFHALHTRWPSYLNRFTEIISDRFIGRVSSE